MDTYKNILWGSDMGPIDPVISPTLVSNHLYIGGVTDLIPDTLDAHSILHIFNVAFSDTYDDDNLCVDLSKYKVKYISTDDNENFNMLPFVNEVCSYIDECVKNKENILVHCYSGINRSVFFCAYYMHHYLKIPLVDVCSILRKQRGIVLANDGFLKQLL